MLESGVAGGEPGSLMGEEDGRAEGMRLRG